MDNAKNITKIHIGADHAGFDLKENIKYFLEKSGYEVVDHGAFELDPEDNFTQFIEPVVREVVQDRNSRGIILGGSGQGEAMFANRFNGIRAVVYYGGSDFVDDRDGMGILALSRFHNDANVLSLGARFLTNEEAEEAVESWLGYEFSGEEKYVRRNEQMNELN